MRFIAKESAAELRTRGLIFSSILSKTPALFVASDLVIVLGTSACTFCFLFESLSSFSETDNFSGDA